MLSRVGKPLFEMFCKGGGGCKGLHIGSARLFVDLSWYGQVNDSKQHMIMTRVWPYSLKLCRNKFFLQIRHQQNKPTKRLTERIWCRNFRKGKLWFEPGIESFAHRVSAIPPFLCLGCPEGGTNTNTNKISNLYGNVHRSQKIILVWSASWLSNLKSSQQ